jgi:hypothetical protein
MIFSGIPAKAAYGQPMTTGITFAIIFLLAGAIAFTYLRKGAL